MAVTVRHACSGDGDAVARAWLSAADYYTGLDPGRFQVPCAEGLAGLWDEAIRRGSADSPYLVAELDGRVVGCLTARVEPPEPDAALQLTRDPGRTRLAVDALVVVREHWRRGVGAALGSHRFLLELGTGEADWCFTRSLPNPGGWRDCHPTGPASGSGPLGSPMRTSGPWPLSAPPRSWLIPNCGRLKGGPPGGPPRVEPADRRSVPVLRHGLDSHRRQQGGHHGRPLRSWLIAHAWPGVRSAGLDRRSRYAPGCPDCRQGERVARHFSATGPIFRGSTRPPLGRLAARAGSVPIWCNHLLTAEVFPVMDEHWPAAPAIREGGGTADREEFTSFYAASFSGLVGQLSAMTGDRAEAQDAVQEAFVRAWVHRGQIGIGRGAEPGSA
jgi:GNAT superfamily N-acetyltransferase